MFWGTYWQFRLNCVSIIKIIIIIIIIIILTTFITKVLIRFSRLNFHGGIVVDS